MKMILLCSICILLIAGYALYAHGREVGAWQGMKVIIRICDEDGWQLENCKAVDAGIKQAAGKEP